MITIAILSFAELTLDNLYAMLALRSQVFVVEQQCVYQDLDYKDQDAKHLLVYDDKQLIAYTRILPFISNDCISFGRLVTAPSHRNRGFGKQLMDLILSHLQISHPKTAISITAQQYLQNFYENYGFVVRGEPFDLDGIPHLLMVKQP